MALVIGEQFYLDLFTGQYYVGRSCKSVIFSSVENGKTMSGETWLYYEAYWWNERFTIALSVVYCEIRGLTLTRSHLMVAVPGNHKSN